MVSRLVVGVCAHVYCVHASSCTQNVTERSSCRGNHHAVCLHWINILDFMLIPQACAGCQFVYVGRRKGESWESEAEGERRQDNELISFPIKMECISLAKKSREIHIFTIRSKKTENRRRIKETSTCWSASSCCFFCLHLRLLSVERWPCKLRNQYDLSR